MNFDKKIRELNHRRIDFFRSFKLAIFKMLFDSLQVFENADQNILVLRLDDKIGDSITSTGFLKALKQENSHCNIIVACGPSTEDIYKNLAFVDQVVVSKKGFFQTLKLFFTLNKKSYKKIINTSHILNPRTVFLLTQLKAEVRLGFENSEWACFNKTVIFKTGEHVTDRYIKLLNNQNKNIDYDLSINSSSKEKAEKYISQIRTGNKKVVILNSFAGARLRNFSKETTFKIVKLLLEDKNIKILSIANKGDHDILKNWLSEFNNENWLQNTEFYNLEDNLALISEVDLVITPDTSVVHMTSAFKKPLVAVYREDVNGDENSVIWAPLKYKNVFQVIAPYNQENPFDINTVDIKQVADKLNTIFN